MEAQGALTGTPGGANLAHIDSCITQLKAQGPSRTCSERKEEVEEEEITANVAYIRQTRPDSGLGFKPKVLESSYVAVC